MEEEGEGEEDEFKLLFVGIESELQESIINQIKLFDKTKQKQKQKQKKLKKECIICMDEEINTAMVPCGHRLACYSCSKTLKNCPICRADIKMVLKTFDAF